MTSKVSKGYNVFCIDKNQYLVDKIIADAFIGTSELYLSHKDGNYLNDHLDNLEYKTIENHLKNIYGYVWKKIENNEKYFISSNGQVWSSHYNNIIKQQFNLGYWSVNIEYPKAKFDLVHKLVSKAFIPNPRNLPSIHHIDGKIENNSTLSNNKHSKDNNKTQYYSSLFIFATSPLNNTFSSSSSPNLKILKQLSSNCR